MIYLIRQRPLADFYCIRKPESNWGGGGLYNKTLSTSAAGYFMYALNSNRSNIIHQSICWIVFLVEPHRHLSPMTGRRPGSLYRSPDFVCGAQTITSRYNDESSDLLHFLFSGFPFVRPHFSLMLLLHYNMNAFYGCLLAPGLFLLFHVEGLTFILTTPLRKYPANIGRVQYY